MYVVVSIFHFTPTYFRNALYFIMTNKFHQYSVRTKSTLNHKYVCKHMWNLIFQLSFLLFFFLALDISPEVRCKLLKNEYTQGYIFMKAQICMSTHTQTERSVEQKDTTFDISQPTILQFNHQGILKFVCCKKHLEITESSINIFN